MRTKQKLVMDVARDLCLANENARYSFFAICSITSLYIMLYSYVSMVVFTTPYKIQTQICLMSQLSLGMDVADLAILNAQR